MTFDTQVYEYEKEFLREYQKILEKHSKKEKGNDTSKSQERIFQIVKEKIYSKFDNQIYSSIETSELDSILEELIRKYVYSSDEQIKQQKITPRIIADLFEVSLGEVSKQKEGTYYTSRTDVMFICKEAVVHFLQNKTILNITKILEIVWSEEKNLSSLNLHETNILTNILREISILDPACGCGEFIIAMTIVLKSIWKKIFTKMGEQKSDYLILKSILSRNLFGIDINQNALNVCQKRLFYLQSSVKEETEKIQILDYQLACKDLLTDSVSFQQQKNSKPLKFDLIIGNPPYLRQETFGTVVSNQNQSGNQQLSYKEKVLEEIGKLSNGKEIHHRYLKSDFYIYFFYKALNSLNEDGVVSFITSNSWLDAKFGFKFQEYLLSNFVLNKIYTNLSQKSFSAAVNTIVTTISNCDIKRHFDSYAKFIAFRLPYYDTINYDNLLNIHSSKTDVTTDDFRLKSITQKKLYEAGCIESEYQGLRWGALFFRAPENYQQILDKIKDKIISLKEIGKLRYPIKTGINQFFFVDQSTVQKFSIEEEFLIPVLKSPKKITNYQITDSDIHLYLFHCNSSKESLQLHEKNGALNYILWGESQTTDRKQQSQDGVNWPDVPSVQRNRPFWYSTPLLPFADVYCTRFFDKRYFFCYSESPLLEDQTFYGLVLKPEFKHQRELIIALLNSTLSYYFLEIFGRTSLGKGALQYTIDDTKNHRIIDPAVIPKSIQKDLISKFAIVKNRKLKSIFDEVKMNDRLEFDRILFDWLQFSRDEREEFYKSIILLTKSRLEKSGQKVEVIST